MIWDVHPGSGFFSHPGSRGQKNTVPCLATLVPTAAHQNIYFWFVRLITSMVPGYLPTELEKMCYAWIKS
jgi:hypothetical protein